MIQIHEDLNYDLEHELFQYMFSEFPYHNNLLRDKAREQIKLLYDNNKREERFKQLMNISSEI